MPCAEHGMPQIGGNTNPHTSFKRYMFRPRIIYSRLVECLQGEEQVPNHIRLLESIRLKGIVH